MNRYRLIGTVHVRRIPKNWTRVPHIGRTDASLDFLTDGICTAAEYQKVGLWNALIPVEALRDALENKLADDGFMLKPFNIDVKAKTVNGVPAPMTVTWL